ncbi:MAG: hypothetical protein QW813_00965 [Candidatus Aenigmatarchaeota archaeon]
METGKGSDSSLYDFFISQLRYLASIVNTTNDETLAQLVKKAIFSRYLDLQNLGRIDNAKQILIEYNLLRGSSRLGYSRKLPK